MAGKDDIKNFGDLKNALVSAYGAKVSPQDRYGWKLLRYIVEAEHSLAFVEINLRGRFPEAEMDESWINQIKLFSAEAYGRFTFSGFPYNKVVELSSISGAGINLSPVGMQWHGCADEPGKYSLYVKNSSKYVRFEKELWGNCNQSLKNPPFSSGELIAGIDAIILAQDTMRGFDEKLRNEAEKIFQSLNLC